MIIRSFTGICYVSIILSSLFYDIKLFSIIMFCFSCLAIFEYQKLLNLKNIIPYFLLGFMYFYFLESRNPSETISIILIITIISQILMLRWLFVGRYKRKIVSNFLPYGYLVFSCFFIIVIPFSKGDYNPKLLMFIFTLNWTNNSFAYLFGKKFGKNKMIPKVSPNKSWEGFWGGLVFTSLIAIIFYKLEVGVNYIQVVVFSFIIPILATLGDLVQSRIKRDKGVKDSGNILPGHGGFYDRMDSIIFIAPWSFYVLNQI